ncbi:response regulator [Paraburkholderia sp. J41]|uniref:response regulator n=1 Tax=Paraburkholderia sp. J41 TaxID=2805433 RepID=UPI002AC37176|nr:response regulator [Paraburkholderia sp. J41]
MDHILIVDDDPSIRHLLRDYLREMGYEASVAANGAQMRQVMHASRVDLIVLDLMLDGEDGLELTRELARGHGVPIVILSARGALLDRIIGLEMGADDYLPKPFDPRELLAKIKVVLRRTRGQPGAAPARARTDRYSAVIFDGWRLDTQMKQILSPEGLVKSLGGSDYRALRTLLDHPNRPLSREFLLDQVFGKELSPLDRAIDVCISRLRQQLGDSARAPKLIRTVRNEGYLLAVQVRYEP